MKLKRTMLLLIAVTASLLLLNGCKSESTGKIDTKNDSSEATSEKLKEVATWELYIEGFYTEKFFISDGTTSDENFDANFYGYMKNPEQLEDGSYSGVVSNDYFSTVNPIQIASTGSILTDEDSIEVMPTYPFDEAYMKEYIYNMQPTFDYQIDDDTMPSGFRCVDVTVTKESVPDIQFAHEEDNKVVVDSLMCSSTCSWKGNLYMTVDGVPIYGSCFFEYRPLRNDDKDFHPEENEVWSCDFNSFYAVEK